MVEFSYIHIPFCTKKCKYCSFVSFVNQNLKKDYVEKLIYEIDKEYKGELQKTLYFGGGTPSLLEIKDIKKIISKFNLEKEAEISFELNPENGSYDYLKSLFDIGINRLSVGIQTFNDEILQKIGRRHNKYDSLKSLENALKAGFKNISADFMYGLLNQDIDLFEKDLNLANSLDITHISTYGLKIEKGTFFEKFPPKNLPDEELQAKMYKLAIEKLTNFKLYEISNFAKEEKYQSRHNLCYWNLEPYYGFGLSASGFDGKKRYKNTTSIKKYLSCPLLKEEVFDMDENSLLEEKIFLGFRKKEGINVGEIEKEFSVDFNKKYGKIIEKYLKTGHIQKTEKGYRLSIEGILISNYILCDFLC